MTTTPLDPPAVFTALQNATSQNPAQLRAAAKAIEAMHKSADYLQIVQSIALERSVPLDIRKMAILQFKNVATSQWRTKIYSDETKHNIRMRTGQFLDEADDVIATANAVAVAKMARIDFPRLWPSLGDDLLQMTETNFNARYNAGNMDPIVPLTLIRSLATLNQVLKELVGIKMPSIARSVFELIRKCHGPLLSVYARSIGSFKDNLTPQTIKSAEKTNDIRIAHLAFKCVVKGILFIWYRSRTKGFEEADGEVATFFGQAVEQFIPICELRISMVQAVLSGLINPDPSTAASLFRLTKHVRLFGKYFRRTQMFSTARFVHLPESRQLVMFYWGNVVAATQTPGRAIADSDEALYPVRFITQALSIFKESLAQWSPRKKATSQTIVEELSPEFVTSTVQLFMNRLMLMDESDLNKWSEDPEEWINMEENDNDAWEFGIRPCAERVLMTLAIQYDETVAPLIKTYWTQMKDARAVTLPEIIQKEALYCAVGRCAHRLREQIHFDEWLHSNLAAEALNDNTNYRIIKRRIAWLFGKWFAENSSILSHDKVWETLLFLLRDQGESSDLAVRLTAATSLKTCVDSITFVMDRFVPFLGPVLESLVTLLREVETNGAKRRVIGVLVVVIGASKERITPLLAPLVAPIPALWEDPTSDATMKASMIEMTVALIKAAKEQSGSIAHLVTAMVTASMQPPLKVQLDGDAIELWLCALRNTPTGGGGATADVFDLLPIAVHQLGENFDILGKALQVIESYMLLDINRVLQSQGLQLHKAFNQVFEGTSGVNVKHLLETVNLMTQLASLSTGDASALCAEAMHVSGFFGKILTGLIDGNKNMTLALVEVNQVFARIILASPDTFMQMVSAASLVVGQTEEWLLTGFLDQWWNLFDNIAEPGRRKLVALATANLLTTGHKVVVERLVSCEQFNIWIDVLGELKEALATDPEDSTLSPLVLFWRAQDTIQLPDSLEDVDETAEFSRREQLWTRDPVRTIPLKEYISTKMQEAEAAAARNDIKVGEVLAKCDASAMESLQKGLAI